MGIIMVSRTYDMLYIYMMCIWLVVFVRFYVQRVIILREVFRDDDVLSTTVPDFECILGQKLVVTGTLHGVVVDGRSVG